MRSFLVVGGVVSAGQLDSYNGTLLPEVLGELPPVNALTPIHERVTNRDRAVVVRPESYFEKRQPDNCVFPIELYLIQDATASFQDNYDSMLNTELKKMVDALQISHPGSTFGLMSFRDKPFRPFGDEGDYCQRFELALTDSYDELYGAFAKLESYGGYDAPENQFGAIVASLQSPTPGWTLASESAAVKLIVVSTDAGPHYEGDDETTSGMEYWGGVFHEANADEQCRTVYYPSPQGVKDEIANAGVYAAFLVYDGDWANGWAAKSWESFNTFIGQTSDFVQPQAEDSGDFWEKLFNVIQVIEDIECVPVTTTTTPTTTESTTLTESAVGPPLTFTTKPIPPTHPEAECSCLPPTDGDCDCPEVVIKLRHKPQEFHLEIENDD